MQHFYDVKYSKDTKLLGPPYYISDYKHWDLQRCRDSFYGPEYDSIINQLKKKDINLYNGNATMAAVHLDKYRKNDYYSYLSNNVKRDIKKAKDLYYFKEYSFDDYIPDFCDISKSQQSIKEASQPPNKDKEAINEYKKAFMAGVKKVYEANNNSLKLRMLKHLEDKNDDLAKEVREIYLLSKNDSYENYVPDFCDIGANKVNPWYLRDPSEFVSDKEKINYWEEHYTKWYGVFRFQKHYKQFDKITNEKLVSYCQVMVDGEMATVGLIWGHASHLKNGAMFYLLTSVISDLIKNNNIKSLIYYKWGQYPENAL
jgi:hypothetical protein